MELWIRRQDKELLVNVKKIYIEFNGAPFEHLKVYNIRSENNLLGTYKTKEIALEVLDEIQYFINDIADNKMVGCVYEMPEE